jgi:ACS family hexuronate transporter-like MFS transporter
LAVLNGVMAISQTNIASLYLQISVEFHQSVYGLGLLASAYFLGYGLLEIPGGIAAARFGPKALVVSGGLLTSAALFACAVAPDFASLEVFRAVAGVGYGLLFAPALVLIIRGLGGGSVGIGSALATVSFSLGGFVGVYGWSVLSSSVGWRLSLLVEFAITLLTVAAAALLVPGDVYNPAFRLELSKLRKAIVNRKLLAVAFAIFGGAATANLTGSFLVYYLEVSLGIQPDLAGLIGSFTYLTPVLTGVAAGRLYDRGVGANSLLVAAAVSVTAGTAVVAYPSAYTALLGSVVAGLAVGVGGTAAFSAARTLAISPEYESLSVSLVDGVSLAGLFVSPLYFAEIAASAGYPLAWLIGSTAAAVFAVPLLFIRLEPETDRAAHSRP